MEPTMIEFVEREFADTERLRRGPLVWRPAPHLGLEEVLYYERETPHRKYGAGLLHPVTVAVASDEAALKQTDTVGIDPGGDEYNSEPLTDKDVVDLDESEAEEEAETNLPDDFEVTSPDIRHPSTLGISFCVHLSPNAQVVLRLPQSRRFFWQTKGAPDFALNGRYELCQRRWNDDGNEREAPMWRRIPAVLPDTNVVIQATELASGQVISKDITMPEASPLKLRFEAFSRRLEDNNWLLTVVLRNSSSPTGGTALRESVLYQTLFEVEIANGHFEKYPESQ
jgi:hypothetical protein